MTEMVFFAGSIATVYVLLKAIWDYQIKLAKAVK